MQIKLSKAIVEKTPATSGDQFLWDTETPGFGVKITPKGKRIYVAQYRVAGLSRRVTIGRHGILTIDKARDDAKARLAEAELGGDPGKAKIDLRHGPTVKELGARYLEEHAGQKKKKSSADDDKGMLDNHIYPAFGSEKAATVTRGQISALHHSLKDKPYAANRVLSLLSKMFSLAEKWGYRKDNTNPCKHVQKYKETKRKRFLNADELSRLGKVLSDIEKDKSEPPQAVAAIRMLIFSGCRLSEILTLKWAYINWDLDALFLPESKTGAKTVPLNGPARLILENQPVIEGNDYVFSGHRNGQHLVGLGHIWQRIREKAGIPDVRIHDLRHSYASVGAAAGLGLPQIGALLGHTQASTTQRYAHLSTGTLKAASEMISGKIDEAMKAEPRKVRRVK